MKKHLLTLALTIILLGGVLLYFHQNSLIAPPTQPAIASPSPTPIQVLGIRTKTKDCQIINHEQDKECTPGAKIPNVAKDQICVPGYSSTVRNVPQEIKNRVYAEYNISNHFEGEYEVDHLISLELGGSNDISNLWPQPATPAPGFHEKDRVENYLHQQVCSDKMSLEQAQIEVSSNWQQLYQSLP